MKHRPQIVSPLLTLVLIALVLLATGILSPARVDGTEELSYVDLVRRLTDMEHLATLPQPGEQCAQWSSWDRRSQYHAASGRYVNWAANGDGDGIIRKEGDELVFAEIEGPGVIWRIWSALAQEGHVKITLDGAEEPAVDLPFIGYFNLENEPFTYPALVHETARGQNCYVPIPFQKSCKITASGDWGRYYHFTYTTYPKGTVLPTFSRTLSDQERRALSRANTVLAECSHGSLVRRRDQQSTKKAVTVRPGETVTVLQLDGTQAITGMEVNVDLPETADSLDVLRELALHMYWDGESQPSVWTPLGDFFGTAPGVNLYRSLPLGISERSLYCKWYMPFKSQAVFKLTNDGDATRRVRFSIGHAPLTRPIESLGRFHAKWHRDAFPPDDPERRKIDWTMLKTEGRGRFCGVMLHVWNPRGGWWGEGDEKFFVDGESFPSTFGTGSEDYFGYAWCDPELFQNCYHNQTISMKNRGHISVNRWHIADNVPFQKSFEAAIEKYYKNDRPTLYAATTYWYQAAGQSDPYGPAPVTERKGYWHPIEVFRIRGALEGEQLPILKRTGGNTQKQDMYGFGLHWSNESHLWWTGAKPGDKLEIALPVANTGAQRLRMQFTKAIDYGIVQLYLNGEKLPGPIDLYNDGVVTTGILDMGVHELTRGGHILQIEIVGANEKAVKGYMVGLDCVTLESVPAPGFYLPEDPNYTLLDSARDSIRFTTEYTLVKYKGHLACKSSFVDKDGNIMGWHDFGNLEGPGWAANAAGGAYELYAFALYEKNEVLRKKALSLLDHVLEDGFIDHDTGFITGYRETNTNRFCLNYQHKNNWFCPGSMARIAYQLLLFSDILGEPHQSKTRQVAIKTAQWIDEHVKSTSNGWYPRRCKPSGEHFPQNAYGDGDKLFETSADGLFIVQLQTALTERGLADYQQKVREKVDVVMRRGGIFGSINHDTYDEHESVAYAVAFRTLRAAARLLDDDKLRQFAYDKCLAGLDQFKMAEDRNGVQTQGLLYMEKSWDTAYLWENAEAASAFFEAYKDTKKDQYKRDGLTILRAIAKHHQPGTGFLTEGVDWNNHVGEQHHFGGLKYGDIRYTEPLLNNQHIVEPTLIGIELGIIKD